MAKRTLVQVPVIKQWADAHYWLRRMRHLDEIPWVPLDRFDIAQELRRESVAIRTICPPDEVVAAADRFVDLLQDRGTTQSCVRVSPNELAADLTVFKWGLAAENLDLAEVYLGLPVRYLGIEIKRERPQGATFEVIRKWHLDVEDRHMLKVIVYLNDVDEACGPFEYLNRAQTDLAVRELNYRNGCLSDAVMNRVVPASEWQQVTGPRLSAVYADTCRLLHRISKPTVMERYSMTFVYSSITPYHRFAQFLPPRRTLSKLRDELTPRQRQALTID
ncbi:hypothetical protein [Mycobacterium sp. MMS18-G62]